MRHIAALSILAALVGCTTGQTVIVDDPCDPTRQINPKQNCLEAAERRFANCPDSESEYGGIEACFAEAEEQRAACDTLPDELVAAGCVNAACLSRACTPASPCGTCTLGQGCVTYYEGKRCGWSWGQCYCKTISTGPATCACQCQ